MTRFLAILALLTLLAMPAIADEAGKAPAGGDKAAASDGLDQPTADDKTIIDFATNAAVGAMTFDGRNFQQQFLNASPHFTKSGWQIFSALLKASGTFDKVVKKNYALTAAAASPAVIKDKGVTDGRYHWKVDVALTLHYQSSDDESDNDTKVHLDIVRVPASDSAGGIQIADWAGQ